MSRSPVSWKRSYRFGATTVTARRYASRSASVSGSVPSSGPTPPSRRTSGGRFSLRWMSEAPAWTAARRSESKSIALRCRQRAVAALAPERGEHAQRDAREAALLAGVREVALEEPLDAAPDERAAREPPRRARPAVDRLLQLPRGAVQRRQRRVDGAL